MKPLSKRTESFTDSVIRRMTRVSLQYGAVNLSQGFPDFDPPRQLTDALAGAAHSGPHQYAITWGAQNFREALARKQSRFMGMSVNPDTDIVVTCGSTEAMLCAMMTVADPGDKVIVFSPFYENYGADAILSGAEPIYVPLTPPDFGFDPEVLEDAFRQGAKALILCNPSNPCGKVFTRDELLCIASMAEKYDAYVITDEVYEHIVYAPNAHTYFASLPGMAQRTLSCSSLSKAYSITGWRLGYIIAPPEIIDVARAESPFMQIGSGIRPAFLHPPEAPVRIAGMRGAAEFYTSQKGRLKDEQTISCLGHGSLSNVTSACGVSCTQKTRPIIWKEGYENEKDHHCFCAGAGTDSHCYRIC